MRFSPPYSVSTSYSCLSWFNLLHIPVLTLIRTSWFQAGLLFLQGVFQCCSSTSHTYTLQSFRRWDKEDRFLKIQWDVHTKAYNISFTGLQTDPRTSKLKEIISYLFLRLLCLRLCLCLFLLCLCMSLCVSMFM